MTSGRYFDSSDANEMVAASAPRSAGGKACGMMLGSALIIKSDSAEESNQNFKWKPYVTLRGFGGFGSHFGASMESVDINKDGLDDLIVGDPSECGVEEADQAEEPCEDRASDAGCIYIYSHLVRAFINFVNFCALMADRIGPETGTLLPFEQWKAAVKGEVWKDAKRICGKVAWGRFGSALARLGDIDQDGFNGKS